MMQWKINEKIAYEWVKKNLDSKAVLHGGSNSNAPDITLSNGDIYEVKSLHAQCGQFTASTAHKYSFSNEIQEYFMGLYDPEELLNSVNKNYYFGPHEICKTWVKAYYRDIKKVKAFLVVVEGKVIEESLEEYFNNHSFSCTYRRKKSGSSEPKFWIKKYLPFDWDYEIIGTAWKIKNPSLIGQQVKGYDTKGTEKTISIEKNGFIRILSNTYTPTFIFNVR